MDEMTEIRLMVLGGLSAVFGLGLAFGWLLDVIAERRERRRPRALGHVLAGNPPQGADERVSRKAA